MNVIELVPLLTESPPLSERAYQHLREAIVHGTLTAGAKLSERSLSAALGISPQPVREALRRLEAEGMVESRPRSGTFVAELTAERVMEMGRIRAALEAVAAGIAARKARDSDIAALAARLSAIRAATRDADWAALADANDHFHRTLHGIAGNTFLTRSLEALRAYFHISSARILHGDEQLQAALAEHAEILEAIAARDPERAETLMRAHTLRSLTVAFPEASATG